MERLQKFLSRAGVASRRHAETMIVDGRVKVNGKVVTELGTRVDAAKDLVLLDGKLVSVNSERKYFLLYKPPGVVTTLSDPEGRPTVADYAQDTGGRVFPVGRLDYDAEGALLLTDDGELANKLMHPSHQVPRVYLAKVKGMPDEPSLQKLVAGVRLEDGMAHAVEARIFNKAEKNTWVKLVVTEGRQHLVKRLCAAIGHPVVRLFRPAHAGISVQGLQPGALRALSNDEIRRVKAAADGTTSEQPALYLPARRHGHAAPGFEPEETEGEARRSEAREPASDPFTQGAPLDDGELDSDERGGSRPPRRGDRARAADARGDGPRGGASRSSDGDERGARKFGGARDSRGGDDRGARSSGDARGARSFGGPRGAGSERGARGFSGPRGGGERGDGVRGGDDRGAGRSFDGDRAGRFGGARDVAGDRPRREPGAFGNRDGAGDRSRREPGAFGNRDGAGARREPGAFGNRDGAGARREPGAFGNRDGAGARREPGAFGKRDGAGARREPGAFGNRGGARGDDRSAGGARGGKRSFSDDGGGGRFGGPRGEKRGGRGPRSDSDRSGGDAERGGRKFGGDSRGRSFGERPGARAGGRGKPGGAGKTSRFAPRSGPGKFSSDRKSGPRGSGGRSSPRKPRGSW